MPKVTITNEKKEIEVPAGANLREALRREGIEVYRGMTRYLNCFGHGTCGECRVLVTKGMENLSGKSVFERKESGDATREDAMRRIRRMFEPGSSVASAYELERRRPPGGLFPAPRGA